MKNIETPIIETPMMLDNVSITPYQSIKFALSLFLLLSALIIISAGAIHIDIRYFNDNIGENSLTEYLQQAYLFTTAVLFALLCIRHPKNRGFYVLVSSFFCVLLIRELDAFFDLISHGFWVYPAALVAVFAIFYAVLNVKTTIEPLGAYIKHNSFGLMLGAMVTLLIFSRLFGMGDLWHGALHDSYARIVKNCVEEGVELLAYSLILFSAGWYYFSETRKSH